MLPQGWKHGTRQCPACMATPRAMRFRRAGTALHSARLRRPRFATRPISKVFTLLVISPGFAGFFLDISPMRGNMVDAPTSACGKAERKGRRGDLYRDGRSESRSLVPSARLAHSGQVPEQACLPVGRLRYPPRGRCRARCSW
jgi:hypothetical protein